MARYFGAFSTSRNDRRVFRDRDSGTYLRRFAWTKIVRQKMVMGTASIDDPALGWYWASRRRTMHASAVGKLHPCCFGSRADAPPVARCCCSLTVLHNPHEWEQRLCALTTAIHKTAITSEKT